MRTVTIQYTVVEDRPSDDDEPFPVYDTLQEAIDESKKYLSIYADDNETGEYDDINVEILNNDTREIVKILSIKDKKVLINNPE